MQQIIRRDVVRVDLADVNAVFALRSEVRDFAATPLAYIVPNKIWLAKAN